MALKQLKRGSREIGDLEAEAAKLARKAYSGQDEMATR